MIFYSPKNLSKKSFFFSRNNEDISEELDACLGSIAVQRNNVFIFVLENLWTHTHSLKERERERERERMFECYALLTWCFSSSEPNLIALLLLFVMNRRNVARETS